jgi:hypothetical protein
MDSKCWILEFRSTIERDKKLLAVAIAIVCCQTCSCAESGNNRIAPGQQAEESLALRDAETFQFALRKVCRPKGIAVIYKGVLGTQQQVGLEPVYAADTWVLLPIELISAGEDDAQAALRSQNDTIMSLRLIRGKVDGGVPIVIPRRGEFSVEIVSPLANSNRVNTTTTAPSPKEILSEVQKAIGKE